MWVSLLGLRLLHISCVGVCGLSPISISGVYSGKRSISVESSGSNFVGLGSCKSCYFVLMFLYLNLLWFHFYMVVWIFADWRKLGHELVFTHEGLQLSLQTFLEDLQIIWLSNLLIMNVTDDDYSRNDACALH